MEFIKAMHRGREWLDQAACAKPPYDSWNWWPEKPAENKAPGVVLRLLELCASCPVRRECLEDCLGWLEHEPLGVFGGSTTKERGAAFDGAVRGTEAWRYSDSRAEMVTAAADLLEATLPARLEQWRRMTAEADEKKTEQGKRRRPPRSRWRIEAAAKRASMGGCKRSSPEKGTPSGFSS